MTQMKGLNLTLLAILLIALDQITKAFVAQNFEFNGFATPLFLGLHTKYTHNTGAAFSLFNNNAMILGLVSAVVSLGILVVLFVNRNRFSTLQQFILVLIFSGAVGNMIDRLSLGYVRDFIYFSIERPKFDFAIFNFADSFVVVGAILLILSSFFAGRNTGR
jgi:signal peptidase II